MEGRVCEMISKNQKFFKFPKMPKSFRKISKRVLNMFWGIFFQNFFLPSVPWRVDLRNVFEKSNNFQISQKCPKLFPKVSKRIWRCFGIIFPKFFLPSFPWRVESSKCFQKIKKLTKFQKGPKSFPNCPKVFWTCFRVLFSKKIFCPVFHGGSSLRNDFKKSKIFQISKNAKIVPKNFQTCFEHVLGYFFPKFFLAQCSMEGRVFEMFSKSRTIFNFSKKAQNCSQKCPNVFEHLLG